MSKTISNDAIWEKLSEMDEKINKVLSKPQGNSDPLNSPSLPMNELKTALTQNVNKLSDKIDDNSSNLKELKSSIQNTQKAINEMPISENIDINGLTTLLERKDIFHFGLVRLKKISFIISVLGILIFILTVFCMKLYSDSLVNQNNYYRQIITTRKLQIENDSLKVKVMDKLVTTKKK